MVVVFRRLSSGKNRFSRWVVRNIRGRELGLVKFSRGKYRFFGYDVVLDSDELNEISSFVYSRGLEVGKR